MAGAASTAKQRDAGQLTNFPVLVRIKQPAPSGEREEEDAFEALEKARIKAQATQATSTKAGR